MFEKQLKKNFKQFLRFCEYQSNGEKVAHISGNLVKKSRFTYSYTPICTYL